jgi:hypothetical protein
MKLKTRIKWLEKNFSYCEPVTVFLSRYDYEDPEPIYKKYLERGGDPNTQIGWLVYTIVPGRDTSKSPEDQG